ncbi:ABC transporter permease [Stieleria varia]|uniref:Transport permease protein n=1 Tax=Stieleria varia TaxID=2528005 RepID=A0A5C6B2A1_9BACT|nr:ABC transporter permease [Stieleria varia]TWU05967.1 Teichoic acid translocation permease protein TagG [Stieleria varia]
MSLAPSTNPETSTQSLGNDCADDDWDLVIRPKRHLLDVDLAELWRYRDLLFMFIKRDIVTVYKQTILGPIWFFVQPVMTMLVYVVVFGNIAKISTDEIPAPLFYLAGITLWNYFSDSFNKTSTTFVSNANVFGKVYFPRLIVPLSIVVSNVIKFGIQFGLFLLVWAWYLASTDLIHPNAWMLSTLYCVLLMAGLGLGFGVIFSSLTTKYRDLTFLLAFGVQLAMYATPIIYPMSTLSERFQRILWWNPIAHIIEAFKYGFLGSGQASVGGLLYTTLFTLTVLTVGVLLFNRTEQTFMDTV